MTGSLRVLCLDIEGGKGGSSRSLYHALINMDRSDVQVSTVCRLGGWIVDAYGSHGIPVTVEPDIPRWTSLERLSRNLLTSFLFRIRDWPRSDDFRSRLLQRLEGVDVLHLNHISLTHLAGWIRRHFPRLKIVMHIRTMPVRTAFAVRQARMAAKHCDGFVFITENERDHFEAMLGRKAPGQVIYNPSEIQDRTLLGHEAVPTDGRLKVLCLSNYSHARGIDRLVDIAEALSPVDRSGILFVVAGNMTIRTDMSMRLPSGSMGASSLPELVMARGLGDCFCFLGHVSDPERVLSVGDVLVKPTRENNPWGRDILEAMAYGLPVASVGTYSRFVETDKTGLLQAQFDAAGVAEFLVAMASRPDERRAIGREGRKRIAELNDPVRQARILVSFWRKIVGRQDPVEMATQSNSNLVA